MSVLLWITKALNWPQQFCWLKELASLTQNTVVHLNILQRKSLSSFFKCKGCLKSTYHCYLKAEQDCHLISRWKKCNCFVLKGRPSKIYLLCCVHPSKQQQFMMKESHWKKHWTCSTDFDQYQSTNRIWWYFIPG